MKNRLFRRLSIPGPYLIIILMIAVLFILVDVLKINNYSGGFLFLSAGNLLNVLNQASLYAIIGFGMTLVIIIAGIDLSVGSLIALSGVLLSMFLVNFNIPIVLSVPLVLAAGVAIGAFHGYLIERFTIPAFVVTLGGMIFYRGLALLLVDGNPIFNSNAAFLFIGNGELLGIPFPLYILAACFAVFHYILRYTQFGRFVYAVGGNEEAARLSGINIFRVKILVHVLCSVSAMISGIILASRLGSGQPLAGSIWELYVITTVIIGGTSLSGGVGTIPWTLAGAVIFGLINNGMNLLNISPYYQWIIRGSVILAAVALKETSLHRTMHEHGSITADPGQEAT